MSLKSRLGLDTKGFQAGLNKAKKDAVAFANSTKNAFKGIAAGLGKVWDVGVSAFRGLLKGGLAVGGAIAATVRHANAFRQQMAEVRTMMGNVSDADFKSITQQVINLSAEFGRTKEELTKGLYQALSAGIPKENAIAFLTTATQTAIAGVTDVETAVDGLTTVINAYGFAASDAGKVSDVMFKTVQLGKTTFAEMSHSIGQIAGIAATSGISFEELAASIATATLSGIQTDKAITGLRATISNILNPSDELKDKLAAIGETGEGLLMKKGLSGGLGEIVKMANGSNAALVRLLPSIEGLPSALAITGTNAAKVKDNLNAIQNAGGATDVAQTQVDGVRHWNRLLQSTLAIITELGIAFDEKLAPFVERISTAINNMRGNPEFDKWVDDAATKLGNLATVVESLFRGGKAKELALEGLGDMLKGYWQIAVETAVDLLKTWAPKIGHMLGEAAGKAISLALTPYKRDNAREAAISDLTKQGKLATTYRVKNNLTGATHGTQDKAWHDLTPQEQAMIDNYIAEKNISEVATGNAIEARGAKLVAEGEQKLKEAQAELDKALPPVPAKPAVPEAIALNGKNQKTTLPEAEAAAAKKVAKLDDFAPDNLAKIGGFMRGGFGANYSDTAQTKLQKETNNLLRNQPKQIAKALADEVTLK